MRTRCRPLPRLIRSIRLRTFRLLTKTPYTYVHFKIAAKPLPTILAEKTRAGLLHQKNSGKEHIIHELQSLTMHVKTRTFQTPHKDTVHTRALQNCLENYSSPCWLRSRELGCLINHNVVCLHLLHRSGEHRILSATLFAMS